jgi:hypothetical protein
MSPALPAAALLLTMSIQNPAERTIVDFQSNPATDQWQIVNDDVSAIYQASFTTKSGQWEQHRLPLKEFLPSYRGRVLHGQPPLDPAQMHSIGLLISDQQEGSFRLEIAWIRLASPSDPP